MRQYKRDTSRLEGEYLTRTEFLLDQIVDSVLGQVRG